MVERLKARSPSVFSRVQAIVSRLAQINTMLKLRLQFRKNSSAIMFPFRATNIHNLRFGSNVFIGDNVWFDLGEKIRVYIGENSKIGRFCQISGGWGEDEDYIWIGKNVLMGDRVFITASDHDYSDVTKPVVEQKVVSKGNITIEDDSWIGIGVCILSNVKIGKHAVIGANAVVVNDVPQYSVAVGNPAKVVKRYDFERRMWVKVNDK